MRRLEVEEPVEVDPVDEPDKSSKVAVIEQFHKDLSKDLIEVWQDNHEEEDDFAEIKLPEHVIKVKTVISFQKVSYENKKCCYAFCLLEVGNNSNLTSHLLLNFLMWHLCHKF